MFRSLSFNYKEVLSTQVQDSQGLLPVKKMDFFLMFWTAWTVSFTKENILQAFKSTGVWPMDPEPVLKKFPPPTTDNKEDPEFEQLEKVLCWKDLQRLFNKVVPDKFTKEAKTLSSSLHYLSTQFALILAENTGLRASLQGKKKHKAARQAAKENKLALQAVAADKRKADKEKREKEKEERAQKIAQRKREREEARSIPAPPKKRKQASKPASNRPSKKQAIKQPGGGALGVGGGGVGSEATLVSPPKVTKSGRNISLASKFR
ncbi:hypothetical protein EJ07DRAFT_116092 [Lizonia empirigonia]|nr:hypothetical protein EJ07DRAFT_116092 [Lizonia empirigonia]